MKVSLAIKLARLLAILIVRANEKVVLIRFYSIL